MSDPWSWSSKDLITSLFAAYALIFLLYYAHIELLKHRWRNHFARVLGFSGLLMLAASIFLYVANHAYIDERVDARYVFLVSRDILALKNPYASNSSFYGPIYNILVSPIVLLPESYRIIVYGACLLAILALITYLVLRDLGFRDALTPTFIIVTNPVLHYYGIAQAQIDDLLLALFIAIYLYTYQFLSRRAGSLVAALATLIKPVRILLYAPMISRRDLRNTYLSFTILAALTLLFYSLYGYYMINNMLLEHVERVEGLSLSTICYCFKQFSYLLASATILIIILFDRDFFRILLASLLTFYIFTPLNFPEYYIWISAAAPIYLITRRNTPLALFFTSSIITGRLWQHLIQSVANPDPLKQAILSVAYVSTQILSLLALYSNELFKALLKHRFLMHKLSLH